MRAAKKLLLNITNGIECIQMSRYVSVVVYQNMIEDVSIFENLIEAASWIVELRRLYGWESTSESLIWDTVHQLPIETEERIEEGVLLGARIVKLRLS